MKQWYQRRVREWRFFMEVVSLALCGHLDCQLSAPYTNFPESSKAHLTLDSVPEDGRVIIIGDVHGCYDELMDLLGKLTVDQDKDKVILVGDMVNKGPKSLEVIRHVMQSSVSCFEVRSVFNENKS
eukprot:TRINITY_DN8236_c0_g1_i1.p1 TRINITY_DN8236_c0_g1~~TRINITY_DN8236_c0_g1_i1.p1  ORF type:complete len:126 (+),score=21.30 TRINITY_DN8236_c0_g1_i1:188-565(+)